MKKQLLSEINRIREVMGLPLIMEDTGKGGIFKLIADIPELINDVEKLASKSLDEIETAAMGAQAGSTEEIAFNLVKKSIDDIAVEAGVNTTNKTLSEIVSDINKLTGDAAYASQKKLYSFLNNRFDDIAQLTADKIKSSSAIKNSVTQGTINAQAMREVLGEIGLNKNVLDDVVSSFFTGGKEVVDIGKKLGINFTKGSEIATDYFTSLQKIVANDAFLAPYKEVLKDKKFMTDAFNGMVKDIQAEGKIIDSTTIMEWFNKKMTSQLDTITNSKEIVESQKSTLRKIVQTIFDPIYGIKKIAAAETAGGKIGNFALVLASLANLTNVIVGSTTTVIENLKSDDEISKEFFILYDENPYVVAYIKRQTELEEQLKEKKIDQSTYDYESEQNWIVNVKKLYDQWRAETYVKASLAGYYYPIVVIGDLIGKSGKNTSDVKYDTHVAMSKRARELSNQKDVKQEKSAKTKNEVMAYLKTAYPSFGIGSGDLPFIEEIGTNKWTWTAANKDVYTIVWDKTKNEFSNTKN